MNTDHNLGCNNLACGSLSREPGSNSPMVVFGVWIVCGNISVQSGIGRCHWSQVVHIRWYWKLSPIEQTKWFGYCRAISRSRFPESSVDTIHGGWHRVCLGDGCWHSRVAMPTGPMASWRCAHSGAPPSMSGRSGRYWPGETGVQRWIWWSVWERAKFAINFCGSR